jgi:hypothetical protein
VFVFVLLCGVASAPAGAGRLWCKTDPIISLDGRLVDITVSIPLDMIVAVNGPVQITVWTPNTVERHVIVPDLGLLGYRTEVVFKDTLAAVQDNRIPTYIKVVVPIDQTIVTSADTVPVELMVTADNQLPIFVQGTHLGTTLGLTILGR